MRMDEASSTPDNLSQTDEESVDEEVVWIHGRRVEDGHLEYYVEYADTPQYEWVDRSDLWDYSVVSRMINEYDATEPITWDNECKFCGSVFTSKSGCEECECDECGRRCRHISGVNYGCPKHPVI